MGKDAEQGCSRIKDFSSLELLDFTKKTLREARPTKLIQNKIIQDIACALFLEELKNENLSLEEWSFSSMLDSKIDKLENSCILVYFINQQAIAETLNLDTERMLCLLVEFNKERPELSFSSEDRELDRDYHYKTISDFLNDIRITV